MAVAGLGSILVGVGQDTTAFLHRPALGLRLAWETIGILVLALVLRSLPEGLRTFMRFFSVLSVAGGDLFATGHDFGIRQGGMERIAAYPMTVWPIVLWNVHIRGPIGQNLNQYEPGLYGLQKTC